MERRPLINEQRDRDREYYYWDSPQQQSRLISLDVFRGISIIGMMLVANQGNFDFVYEQLKENSWDGIRFCDFIFPWFLFIMGVAIPLAIRNQRKTSKTVWFKIVKRTVLLFLLGLAFNIMAGKFTFSHFRIMGVLQRTSICSFVTAVLHLTLPVYIQRVTVIGIIIIYVSILYGFQVPDCGAANVTMNCNAAGYIDRVIFGQRFMRYPIDPEGILSTLTAIFTTFVGLETGRVLAREKAEKNQEELTLHLKVLIFWLIIGMLFTFLGAVFSIWIPFNKQLWSLSFACFTAGVGVLLLALCYYLIDFMFPNAKLIRTTSKPFIWLGSNPLAIFIGMIGLEIILMDWVSSPWAHINYNGTEVSAWTWLYWNGFQSWIKNEDLASLLFAWTHLFLWTLVAGLLYWKKLFFKL